MPTTGDHKARPGIEPLRQHSGHDLSRAFAQLQQRLHERWADPEGMTLLHGDLNPTNVLRPLAGGGPLFFIDRQPFDWSLTYGLAVHDLAYALLPWWPDAWRRAYQWPVLRAWHAALGQTGYRWHRVVADWQLSVLQCLCVPLEWCSKPETAHSMRWLWQAQLARLLAAGREGDCDFPA